MIRALAARLRELIHRDLDAVYRYLDRHHGHESEGGR
jgi:hypothetical protein